MKPGILEVFTGYVSVGPAGIDGDGFDPYVNSGSKPIVAARSLDDIFCFCPCAHV